MKEKIFGNWKRASAIFLALLLVISIIPVAMFAGKKKTITVSASGAKISSNKMTLCTTGTSQLTVKYGGKKVSPTKAKYSSSKKNIATVSKKGVITAKKKGKTVISIKYKGKTKKITLTVNNPKVTVKANNKSVSKLSMKVGAKSNLTMYVGYKNSGAKKYTTKKIALKNLAFSSSNKKVATVNKSGRITAKKAGKTTITVKYKTISKKITLTVSKKKTTTTKKPSTTTTKKPSTTTTTNKKPITTTTKKPTTCSHKWVAQYKTVNVPAVTQQVPKTTVIKGEYLYTQYTCACGEVFKDHASWRDHSLEKMLETGTSNGHSVSQKDIYAPDKTVTTYETKVVTPATTKKELTGYKCSKCGATK